MLSLFRKVIDDVTVNQDAATAAYVDASGGTKPSVGYASSRYDNQPGQRRGNSCSPARLKHATEAATILRQYREALDAGDDAEVNKLAPKLDRAFARVGADADIGPILRELLDRGPRATDRQLWTPGIHGRPIHAPT